jgi:methylated-DNA-[protein]-cysteine S-methyltransferase
MSEIERSLKQSARELPLDVGSERISELASRAIDEGLVDVAYGFVDSPLGRLTVAATPKGLIRIAYPFGDPDHVLEELAARVSPRLLEAPAYIDEVRRELEEYFDGRRTRFDLPLDWTLTRGFHRRVLRATERIGYGEVRTYTEVAARAGSARAVRAAGNALASNPIPVVVPCHRVVRTGGGLGGYAGGLERKEFLLALEGQGDDSGSR